MTDKPDMLDKHRQFDALTGATPYIPEGYSPFAPEDWAENQRRANAISADAKFILSVCALSFLAGMLVDHWIWIWL